MEVSYGTISEWPYCWYSCCVCCYWVASTGPAWHLVEVLVLAVPPSMTPLTLKGCGGSRDAPELSGLWLEGLPWGEPPKWNLYKLCMLNHICQLRGSLGAICY